VAGAWNVFRIRIIGDGQSAQVQARVWDQRDPEPAKWQIDCSWSGSMATVGAPGVWSAGPGEKLWDDLSAIALPATDPEPDPRPDGEPLYSDSFEGYPVGSDPTGWMDTARKNSMLEADELFAVQRAPGGGRALATSSTYTNIHSHFLADGSESWSDYELRGRMFIADKNGGIGVTLYSDYPNSDTYFRLRRHVWQRSFGIYPHFEGDLQCNGSNVTGVRPRPATWYRFRFRAEADADATRLRAKVWADSEAEPDAWQVDCHASGPESPVAGAPGVWSMGRGAKHWDDLEVVPIRE
jgi:hypothetical protein